MNAKYRIFAIAGLCAVVVLLAFALLSGKPNETPQQYPETTPPPQREQAVDPKSQGGPGDPDRR